MFNRGKMNRLLTAGMKTEFMKGRDTITPIWDSFAMEISSDKKKEEYGWLGSTPKMHEFQGERKAYSLNEYGFTVTNKKFESTIAVDQDAIDDDLYGAILMQARMMGADSKEYYDEYAVGILEANGLCFDGQNFFDTDHSFPGGYSTSQVNYSSSSLALSATNLKTVINTMMKYLDDKQRLLNVKPKVLMVPTVLQWTAEEICSPKNITSSATTVADRLLEGKLKVVVNPYLSNTGDANAAYYVMDDNYRGLKPMVFQNRKPIQFDQLNKSTDLPVFMTDTHYYGTKARFNFGYGNWYQIYKAKG